MKNRLKMSCTMQKTFMYANTKLQNRVYLFRYSREQTANTTAHVLLRRAGAEVDVKVFKNLTAEDIHDSVELFAESNRPGADYHVPRRILRR